MGGATYVVPVIIGLYFIAVLVAGVLAGRGRARLSTEWMVSSRELGTLVMVLLMGAGGISAYSFLGAPGWALDYGIPILYVVVYLCVGAFGTFFWGPRFRDLGERFGLLTQAEIFGDRFESKILRPIVAIFGIAAAMPYVVLQVKGCGYVFQITTGGLVPFWLGALIGVLVTGVFVYTSGLRGVGWANVVMGATMFVIAFATMFAVLGIHYGTWSPAPLFLDVFKSSPQHLTLPGNKNFMSTTFWSTSIIVCSLGIPGFLNQVVMYLGGKSGDVIRKQAMLVPIYYFIIAPCIIIGFLGVLKMPGLKPSDTVILRILMTSAPVWMLGLLCAGAMGAAVSSAAPIVQASAGTVVHDVVRPYYMLDEAAHYRLVRYMVVPVSAVGYVLALKDPRSLVYILLVAYGLLAQLAVAYIGIFIWPRANAQGTLCGLLAGFLVTCVYTFGPKPHPGGIHAGIFGLVANVILFVVVSVFTKPNSRSTIERYFPDLMERLYE